MLKALYMWISDYVLFPFGNLPLQLHPGLNEHVHSISLFLYGQCCTKRNVRNPGESL
jgi:hypothetical protein